MKILMTTALLVALAGTAAPQTTVKGRWSGTITATRGDGSTSNDNALLILDQKDTAITGTVGGNDDDQHPITSGKVDGKKIIIDARHAENGREYHFELTVENDEMKGDITSGGRKAVLTVKREKK
jgi:hypothetical protein